MLVLITTSTRSNLSHNYQCSLDSHSNLMIKSWRKELAVSQMAMIYTLEMSTTAEKSSFQKGIEIEGGQEEEEEEVEV